MQVNAAKARWWTIVAVLAGLVLLVYWPVGGHDYVSLDDPLYLADNPAVRRGLTVDGIVRAFSTLRGGNWHPVTWISHMASASLFGLDPGPHHLVNLALHLTNAVLLLLLLRGLTGTLWASFLVAALFAIHPLHVESVAWISERKDVLSTFFLMLALLAYLRGVRTGGRYRFLPVVAAFGLGLMAKPMLVTLPFLLLLLDYWPLGRLPGSSSPRGRHSARPTVGALALEKTPLFVLSAAASILAFVAQTRSQAVTSFESLGIGERIANALLSYLVYLWKTVWPHSLAVFYPYDHSQLGLVPLLAILGLLCGITAAVVIARRGRPYLVFGWLWYLVTLAPVIGVVQVGAQARADRYTYVPLIGIFILVLWGARALVLRRRILLLPAVAVAVVGLGALGTQSRIQVGYWRDSFSLFTHNLEVVPGDALSMKNLGIALAARGQKAEADRLLARAYALNPALRSRSHFNLARTLEERGNYSEAARYLREALRLDPGFEEAREALGRVLREHPDASVSRNGEAPESPGGSGAPTAGDAHRSIQSPLLRGDALARLGRYDEAILAYREAIRMQPDHAGAHNNLGCALAALGRHEEARGAFRDAIRLQPDFTEARRNLARTPGGNP